MAQRGNNISRTKSSLPDAGFMAYVITFAITFRPADLFLFSIFSKFVEQSFRKEQYQKCTNRQVTVWVKFQIGAKRIALI